MALSLGIAAAFFGVAFIIVGWKGGGPQTMEKNMIGMIKGQYLTASNASTSVGNSSNSNSSKGATSTNGGTYGNSGSVSSTGTPVGPGTNE